MSHFGAQVAAVRACMQEIAVDWLKLLIADAAEADQRDMINHELRPCGQRSLCRDRKSALDDLGPHARFCPDSKCDPVDVLCAMLDGLLQSNVQRMLHQPNLMHCALLVHVSAYE